jgi:NitT/TauT family transport system permease protein
MRNKIAPSVRHVVFQLAPLLTMLLILGMWQLATYVFNIAPTLLPSPSAIVRAGFSINWEEWVMHVDSTLRVALAGYLVSIIISIPLAIVLALSPLLSRAIYPILVVISTTPIVAVAPIIIVLLGIGELPRIVITSIISFFPLVISTTTGILLTPEELLELSRSLRATKMREICQIRIPYAIPHIFSGLKISITLAVIGAVVGEFVAADKGLGYGILFTTSTFKVALSFAMLGVLVTTSLILFNLLVFIQKKFFPWSIPRSVKV